MYFVTNLRAIYCIMALKNMWQDCPLVVIRDRITIQLLTESHLTQNTAPWQTDLGWHRSCSVVIVQAEANQSIRYNTVCNTRIGWLSTSRSQRPQRGHSLYWHIKIAFSYGFWVQHPACCLFWIFILYCLFICTDVLWCIWHQTELP